MIGRGPFGLCRRISDEVALPNVKKQTLKNKTNYLQQQQQQQQQNNH
jgi:hypothetical protein